MFNKFNKKKFRQFAEGIELQTIANGDNTSMVLFRIKAGTNLPAHAHPHEQTGYLLSGKMTFRIEKEQFEVSPGDSWCVPSNAEHEVTVHEDVEVLEVFSPVREEYL